MPVILNPGSEELQAVLKPYEGELDCYQVPREVGKVGNNSPDFVVPVDSKENKNNIANFFANAKKKTEPTKSAENDDSKKEDDTAKPVSGVKREHPEDTHIAAEEDTKKQKTQTPPASSPVKPSTQGSAVKQKQMRSATHNQKPLKKADSKKASDGSQRITSFFSK
jgi:hypothetical protein